MKPVKIVFDKSYETDYRTASCEVPGRVSSIMDTLSPLYETEAPQPCSEDDILLCHSEGLLIVEKNDRSRYDVARMAAGGAIMAARLAIEGTLSFAVVRPPGHHANPDHNWGFCFFNNMGIAVRKILSEKLIHKAVILDIDLHFGDGTDAIFHYDDAVRVLNIQSSTRREFIQETRSALKDAGSADILGISAGFDQYELDWGANLTTGDYHEIGVIAGTYARDFCSGRVFILLEGGYYLPDLGANALSLLTGVAEGVDGK